MPTSCQSLDMALARDISEGVSPASRGTTWRAMITPIALPTTANVSCMTASATDGQAVMRGVSLFAPDEGDVSQCAHEEYLHP